MQLLILQIWGAGLIIVIIMMIRNMFKITENSVRLSNWSRLLTLWATIPLFLVLAYDVLTRGDFSNVYPHGLQLLLAFGAGTYIFFRIGCRFEGDLLIWSLGLLPNKMRAGDIDKIVFCYEKSMITSILLVSGDKEKRVRDDFNASIVITNFARIHNIRTTTMSD